MAAADGRPVTRGERMRGYAVHLYTASGIVLAFLATAELCRPRPDPRWIFALFAAATLIDATDGSLARRWQVKRTVPEVEGRTIDDIVDYITYTFLPLVLVWRMSWLPSPELLWVAPALIASLFGFANVGIKDESGGFFLGWPSMWNVVAFYAGLFAPAVNAAMLLLFALLTLVPVRFLYLTVAPRPWKVPLLAGAAVWLALMLAMLPSYPDVAPWMLWLSLAYPVLYSLLSWRLSVERREPQVRTG